MDAEALIGQKIRGYILQTLIGEGGFGAVYRAQQDIIDREVAIKIVLPEFANDPHFIRQFETEARVVARLEHPYIVPLFDFWREPDRAFLVMRYYPAGSLERFIFQNMKVSPEQTSTILDQIANALDTAHNAGVIHRDIKPENILMDSVGNAYLTDFGVAKSDQIDVDDNNDEDLSVTGSPAYLPPELLQGKQSTRQSDIYSLGFVIYEMLAGKHPFADSSKTLPINANDTVTRLLVSHLKLDIPPLEGFSPDVNYVLEKATRKEPENRYENARLFARDFRQAIEGQPLQGNTTEFIRLQINNPYKGLRAFEEADSSDFFGREDLISDMLELLEERVLYSHFLAVIGPSGSGKSSVVFAGLLPSLRAGAIENSDHWYIVDMVPGAQPFENLEQALLSAAHTVPGDLMNTLTGNPAGLQRAVDQIFENDDDELLIVIDQFEELFTLTSDISSRNHFLALIETAIDSPESRVRVIITLRADFYDRPLMHEGFGTLIQQRTQLVLPLNSEQLRETIVGPAERVGLSVDPELVAAIMSDLREETGILPLLQHALSEVFVRRDGMTLTHQGYIDSGGVRGALTRRADTLFNDLPDPYRPTIRQIFLRLVTLGEGTEDIRRRARLSELASDTETVQTVLDVYGKHRLLTFDRDPETREPTVEVAHEALIREWPRLRIWLDDSRHDIRQQRILATSAQDWIEAGQDNSYLLRGARLTEFVEWAKSTSVKLSQQEADFLKISHDEANALEAAETERAARERQLEQRSQRRLRAIVGLLLVASVLGVGLTYLIYQQSLEAQRERDLAQQAREESEISEALAQESLLEARSLTLATNAQQAWSDGENVLALSLAMEAANINAKTLPNEVADTLAEVAFGPGVNTVLNEHNQPVVGLSFSSNGRYLLAVDGNMRAASIPAVGDIIPLNEQPEGGQAEDGLPRDGPPGGGPPGGGPPGGGPPGGGPPGGGPPGGRPPGGTRPPGVSGPPGSQEALQGGVPVSPETYTALHPPNPNQKLILWDTHTNEIVTEIAGDMGNTSSAVLVPSENEQPSVAITGGWNGTVIAWDLETGEEINRLELQPSHIVVSATEDGRILVSSGVGARTGLYPGEQYIWHYETGVTEPIESHRSSLWIGRISADGAIGASAHLRNTLVVWDVSSGEETMRIEPSEEYVRTPAFDIAISPDGTKIATHVGTNLVQIYDSQTGEQEVTIDIGTATVSRTAFDSTGNYLLIGSESGFLGIWNIAEGAFDQQLNNSDVDMTSIAFSPDGSQVAVGLRDFSVRIWDMQGNPGAKIAEIPNTGTQHGGAIIPGSHNVLTRINNFDFLPPQVEMNMWDGDTGEHLALMLGHHSLPVGIAVSPDGRYALTSEGDATASGRLTEEPPAVILWDLETGQEVRRLSRTLEDFQRLLAFDPTGASPLQAITDWNDTVRLWNLETGEVIREFSGPSVNVTALDFSPDGKMIAAGSPDGTIFVWDASSGERLHSFNIEVYPFVIHFAHDGEHIISNYEEEGVALWNMRTGEEVIEYVGHEEFVSHADLSRDGMYLATTAHDLKLNIWNVETGGLINTLPSLVDRPESVSFSDDGSRVLVVPHTGEATVWMTKRIPIDEIQAWVAENRFARPFTEPECVRYRIEGDCEEEGEEEHHEEDQPDEA